MNKLTFFLLLILTPLLSEAQDGWMQFTQSNSNIPSNQVNTVYTAVSGDVWVATDQGLSKFENGTFTTYTTSDGLANNDVVAINEDGNGNIWISYGSSGGGVTQYDGITFTTYTSSNGLSDNRIEKILRIGANVCFVDFINQISLFDGTSISILPIGNLSHIAQLNIDNLLLYFFGAGSYLYKYDGVDTTRINLPTGISHANKINYIADNDFIIYSFQNGDFVNYRYENGNYSLFEYGYRIEELFKDVNGTVWSVAAATPDMDMLLKLEGNNITSFDSQSGYNAMKLFDATADSLSLYIATNNGMLKSGINMESRSYDSLSVNNLKPYFNSSGNLGVDNFNTISKQFFSHHLDYKDGKSLLFHSNLSMGGVDQSGQLYLAGDLYSYLLDNRSEYRSGPIGDTNSLRNTQGKVWKVSKGEILYHQLNYMYSNYEAPDGIATWPAHGNTDVGEAACLAPYHDVNQDGVYNPSDGDYPYIRGDEALYMIYNDWGTHYLTGGEPIGAEIHMMAYAYDSNSTWLENTIFANYRVINRSQRTYSNFRLGLFADYLLGSSDNFIGCDSTLSLMYCYNADNFDQSLNGVNGFGINPPAFGITFLNKALDKHFLFTGSSGFNGLPQSPVDYYNYMNGRWLDGTQLIYGGSGYMGASTPPYVSTGYMFSGDPVNNIDWTELSAGNSPAQRSAFGVSDGLSFAPNDVIDLDIAYVYARDTSQNNLENINVLKSDVSALRNWYNQQAYPQFVAGCNTLTNVSEGAQDDSKSEQFLIYPNPNDGQFTIKSNATKVSLKVTSVDGRVIQQYVSEGSNIQMDLSDQPTGLYFITLETDQGKEIRKVIVQ